MADRSDLIVGGFFFGSFDDAAAAERELKNAEYLEERLGTMNLSQMKAVYDKMLDQKVFSTPVGWEFLKSLRARLEESGIPEEELRPIPLYNNFAAQKDSRDHKALMRIKPVDRERNTKMALRGSVILNIILVILILAMFAITMKSDNPNILNYEEAILNRYAAWEQNLSERENAVREKEKELEDSAGR
ncbi:MAG: hypothetical protein K6F53_12200 [Lachnospiraceae bacterium]|nr:hypothetical protein [Lachnospiraceae bacterium]